VIREELARLLRWEERHRRLIARLVLVLAGRVVDVFLEVWAVIVVAGSAGAIASFFQSADP